MQPPTLLTLFIPFYINVSSSCAEGASNDCVEGPGNNVVGGPVNDGVEGPSNDGVGGPDKMVLKDQAMMVL